MDLVHTVALEKSIPVDKIYWMRVGHRDPVDITEADIVHTSHRSTLLKHSSLGPNILKVSTQVRPPMSGRQTM